MIRERFLKKQNLTQVEDRPIHKEEVGSTQVEVESSKKGKFYEGSSDEEDGEEEGGQQVNKSAGEVLGSFKSFSSVWQDSDEEDPKEEKKDTKKSLKTKRVPESKTESTTPRVPQESFNITRYDPTVENQEQFFRAQTNNEEQDKGDVRNKSNKFFEIKTDLKQAFDSKKSSSGFSFGFLGGSDSSQKPDQTSEILGDQYESDDDVKAPVKKNSSISTFGMQLKGKGVVKRSSSFFFSEDDPRYEEGVSYFFDHEVNFEELRQKHTENRPVLSDILKKRFRNKQKKSGHGKHDHKKQQTFKGKRGRKFTRKSRV